MTRLVIGPGNLGQGNCQFSAKTSPLGQDALVMKRNRFSVEQIFEVLQDTTMDTFKTS